METSSFGWRLARARRGAGPLLAACAAALTALASLGAAPAGADSLTVSATPNPLEWTYTAQTTITVTGAAAYAPARLSLFASYKPAAGGSCAPTYQADATFNGSGRTGGVLAYFDSVSQAPDGSFTAHASLSTMSERIDVEPYLICAWVKTADGSQLTGSTDLRLVPPPASISLSRPVANPSGAGFRLTVTYSSGIAPSEVRVYAYDDIPGTRPCPAQDVQYTQIFADSFFYRVLNGAGPFSSTSVATEAHGQERFLAGLWRVCGYVTSSGDPDVVFAAATANVIIPTPGSTGISCKVPNLAGKSLVRAKRSLIAAHCAVGRITRKKRAGKRRGTVLSQSVRPGKTLPKGSTVGMVVAL